jgi:hypothetical protein
MRGRFIPSSDYTSASFYPSENPDFAPKKGRIPLVFAIFENLFTF